MTPALEKLQQVLKQLPGLGYRSAERVALHLLVEKPERRIALVEALTQAAARLSRCQTCGNICETDPLAHEDTSARCSICLDPARANGVVCVVEQVPDLMAMERSSAFAGRYHVLYGKLSPINNVGEGDLNFSSLRDRISKGEIQELILALSNDIEGEATCHFLQEEVARDAGIRISRIGFGLPSGSGLGYVDATTLRSALEGRRTLG